MAFSHGAIPLQEADGLDSLYRRVGIADAVLSGGIGLQLDLKILTHLESVLLATVITSVAVVSKLMGCGLGATRMGWVDALKVGAGMVPRGEVGVATMARPRMMSLAFRNRAGVARAELQPVR